MAKGWRSGGVAGRRRLGWLLVLALAGSRTLAAQAAAAPAAGPSFDRAVVPAAGRQLAELRVAEFGRYSIAVESRVGVALQVVDRMAGAGPVEGEAGARDGRVDLFLDRGEVRVVALGPNLGRGEARLAVRTFRELSPEPAPLLVEERLESSELGDLEQRSWWLEIAARRRVVLEAAGRHLADLRLWQGGSWLVDAEPRIDRIEPLAGRPLRRARLAAELAPGLYRLTAYGGVEEPWPQGGAERPLHLRWGLPRRSAAARDALTVGPFGSERFLVPARANFFRIELPEGRPATLGVAAFDPEDPFAEPELSWSVTKESLPPVAEGSYRAEEGWLAVTVSGAAGERVLLQHFDATRRVELAGKGRYWIGSVHAGAAGDSIDATGVLFAWPKGAPERTRVEAAQAIALASTRSWRRRFNLLEPATLFLRVLEAGSFQLAARGAAAEFRLEPLRLDAPPGYEPPPLRPAPAEWQLDPGYYVLTLVPKEVGIAEVALRPRSGAATSDAPLLGAVRFGVVALRGDTSYELLINDQPGVTAGPIARPLPLDLDMALPLPLAPGEEIEVPARAKLPSLASARAEDGSRLELAAGGGAWSESLELAAGEHLLRVRSARSEPVTVTLGFEPIERRAATPLPALPAPTLAALPAFPRLAAGPALPFDLGRRETATFLIEAEEPALYLVDTTGLLATEASLRTRVRPRLAAAAENGSGRNAALRAYLREGDYQLTVAARGESAGHLGARLRRAALADGGALADGDTARATLPADGAVAYRFAVAEPSTWRLSALALGGPLAFRVEDADGWPVAAPVFEGEARLALEPGGYRAIVLPRGTPARALTRLERVVAAARAEGHGPHPLAFGAAADHLWTETPAAGEPRRPDRWTFTLPAAANVTITLSDEMEGELLRLDPDGAARVGAATALRPFGGALEPGDYAFDARCSRRNHRAPYTIRLESEELLEGTARAVRAPANLALSTSGAGEVEISSYGAADVRARLFAGDGRLLAASDDRPDDWNFLISRRLPADRYRLRVDPVGAASATTRVEVRRRGEASVAPWAPASAGPREVVPAADALLLPLELPATAELLAVVARATEPVALTLERGDGGEWSPVAAGEGREPRLAVPLERAGEGGAWRLRVRSLDGRATAVQLTGFAGTPPRADERALARGVVLRPLPGLEPALALAVVGVERPGCFALDGETGDLELLAARRAGEALAARPGLLVAGGDRLWLAAATVAEVVARRTAVGESDLVVWLSPGEEALCDLGAPGLAAVEASSLAGDLALEVRPDATPGAWHLDAGFAPQHALVLARGAGAVAVRNAGERPLEARLAARRLSELPAAHLVAGALTLELPPGTLRRVVVEGGAGAAEVEVALGRGGVAAAADVVAWGADSSLLAHLEGAAELELANPTDAPVAFSVERAATVSPRAEARVEPGRRPFERAFTRAGWLAVAVAPQLAATDRIEVRGATRALLVRADGRMQRGTSLAAPVAGGRLYLEHGAGPLVVWSPAVELRPADVGFEGEPPAALALRLPARLDLDGARRRFAIELPAPGILTLLGTAPAAVAVEPDAGAPRVEAFTEGVRWTLALPAGATTIDVRALGGEPLSGRLDLALTPLEPAAEGLGAAVRLAPGSAFGYGFRLERARPIGVGVTADGGAAEALLFDSGGGLLGRGAALFRSLEPGDYRLALTAPPDGPPLLVRPVVVGLATPASGPPPEAIAALLALERGEPPAPRAVTGSEDARRWFEGAESPSEEEETGEEEPMDGEAEWEGESREPIGEGEEELDSTPAARAGGAQ